MTESPSPSTDPTPSTAVLTRIRKYLPRRDTPVTAEQAWAQVAHFGGAAGMLITGGVGGWVAPLIALIAKGNQSPTLRAHAINALNFQLLWSIIGVLAWLVVWRPPVFLPLLVVTVIGVVFGIIGGLRATEGQQYKYPLSASLIK